MLSSEASAELGRWNTNRAPYQRDIMDAYNDDRVKSIVMMFSTQTGKTEILNNIIGYNIDLNPGPIMVIQPTEAMAKTWSKDRFTPMVRDSPCFHGKIKKPRSKDSDNTILHKMFPGGHITVIGANAPASLASRPVRDALCDEVDRYPASAGREGDPVDLVRRRLANFPRSKLILASTPTIKGFSRIEMAYEDSDQRRYYVPCPKCKTMQTLKWRQVKWDKNEKRSSLLSSVRYECESCRYLCTEIDRHKMLAKGKWVAGVDFNGIAGFHLNELYSPWSLVQKVVEGFLDANTVEKKKTWTNTSLAETWEEEGEDIAGGELISRREQYNCVPMNAYVIVAGVDVQDDRLECEIKAFGEGLETWGISYHVIWGDPNMQQVWSDLDGLLTSTFEHESGSKMMVAATCIDSGGHHTQIVYDYVKKRSHRRIFATKGVAGVGRPIVSAPAKKQTGKDKRDVELFTIGVDSAKSLLYSNLRITQLGPNYQHFPESYDAEYFEQLTAEKIMTKYKRGFPVKEWVKTRPRNEALDINVLCYAAVRILNPVFDALKRQYGAKQEKKLMPVISQSDKSIAQRSEQRRKPPQRRGSGFVNGWKK